MRRLKRVLGMVSAFARVAGLAGVVLAGAVRHAIRWQWVVAGLVAAALAVQALAGWQAATTALRSSAGVVARGVGPGLWWTWPLLVGGLILWRGREAWRWLRAGARAVWRYGRRRALLVPVGLGVPVLGGLFVVAVFVLPDLLVPAGVTASEERLVELRNSVRGTLLQAAGGLLLVLGAIATWRQLYLNRESQVTERYTRAIEQLGKPGLDLQLGGLYALERLARDSPADQPTIVEVLTAFVRQRARAEPDESREAHPLPPLQERRPAVQAAMRVLGRIPRPRGVTLELAGVDLRDADLREADLVGADLRQARLDGARLEDAQLGQAQLAGAHLSGAVLWYAGLSRADLGRASLTGAALWSADLRAANLGGAKLTGASLQHADLTGAYGQAVLTRADLRDADLTGAYFLGADLAGADLTGAKLAGVGLWRGILTGAVLAGADLTGAGLRSADLRDADLTGARLPQADLGGANLAGTQLAGADLSATDLGRATLRGARCDPGTRWPRGFDPAAAGIDVEARPGGRGHAAPGEPPPGPTGATP